MNSKPSGEGLAAERAVREIAPPPPRRRTLRAHRLSRLTDGVSTQRSMCRSSTTLSRWSSSREAGRSAVTARATRITTKRWRSCWRASDSVAHRLSTGWLIQPRRGGRIRTRPLGAWRSTTPLTSSPRIRRRCGSNSGALRRLPLAVRAPAARAAVRNASASSSTCRLMPRRSCVPRCPATRARYRAQR